MADASGFPAEQQVLTVETLAVAALILAVGAVRKIVLSRRRLAEMGVYAGTAVEVIQQAGGVIVEVRGHRLLIGRGMAERVYIDEAP